MTNSGTTLMTAAATPKQAHPGCCRGSNAWRADETGEIVRRANRWRNENMSEPATDSIPAIAPVAVMRRQYRQKRDGARNEPTSNRWHRQ